MNYYLDNITIILTKYNIELTPENITKALFLFPHLLTSPTLINQLNSNDLQLTLTEEYLLQCLTSHHLDRHILLDTILADFKMPTQYRSYQYFKDVVLYILNQDQKIALKFPYYITAKKYNTNSQNILTAIYNLNQKYIQKDSTKRIKQIIFKNQTNLDNSETIFTLINYIQNLEFIINTPFSHLLPSQQETFINQQLINNTLKELGFLPNFEGYKYLQIILLHYQNNTNNWGFLKRIAKSLDTCEHALDTDLRNSINAAINTPANQPLQHLIFNTTNSPQKTSYIANISDYIKYLKTKYHLKYHTLLTETPPLELPTSLPQPRNQHYHH